MNYSLSRYLLVFLLAAMLSACDEKSATTSPAPATPAPAGQNSSNAQQNGGQQIALLDGFFNFLLPADMSDQTGALGNPNNNIHIYSDSSGQKTVIVIVNDASPDSLEVMASRLEAEQRKRDPQLQVISSKRVEISGHPLWRFDSVMEKDNNLLYSSILFGNIDNKQLTMQITLPDHQNDNHQNPQNQAAKILQSIILK